MMSLTHPVEDLDFCVVDTETTGGSAVFSRVIDVAVFHYRNGMIVDRFKTLINPERPIPPWITQLTGIDNDMVKRAPTFKDIAADLHAILQKGHFTAHNAGFDFGFLQQEFARTGFFFSQPQVCTLRLARILLPELPSRSLGMLCEHLLIDIWDRHRAYGDAEATVYVLKHLLKQAAADYGVKTWGALKGLLASGPLVLPEGISSETVAQLPEGPGVYLFKNAAGEIVFKGKCTNIQRRVRTHFAKSNCSAKAQRFREVVAAIEIA